MFIDVPNRRFPLLWLLVPLVGLPPVFWCSVNISLSPQTELNSSICSPFRATLYIAVPAERSPHLMLFEITAVLCWVKYDEGKVRFYYLPLL